MSEWEIDFKKLLVCIFYETQNPLSHRKNIRLSCSLYSRILKGHKWAKEKYFKFNSHLFTWLELYATGLGPRARGLESWDRTPNFKSCVLGMICFLPTYFGFKLVKNCFCFPIHLYIQPMNKESEQTSSFWTVFKGKCLIFKIKNHQGFILFYGR